LDLPDSLGREADLHHDRADVCPCEIVEPTRPAWGSRRLGSDVGGSAAWAISGIHSVAIQVTLLHTEETRATVRKAVAIQSRPDMATQRVASPTGTVLLTVPLKPADGTARW
jgi:hypothetical protein